MKKRILGFFILITFFAFFIGIKKTIDAGGTSTKKLGFINSVLSVAVKTIENIEEKIKNDLRRIGIIITYPFRKYIKATQPSVSRNPYAYVPARVRIENDVFSPEEKEFLSVRKPKVKRALEDFLGIRIPENVEVPNIMISLSGGGSRAMIHAWSVMRALDIIGLVDCSTHVSSLSGSTWFLWPWLASGLSLKQYEKKLLSDVTHGAKLRSIKDIKFTVDFILRELAFNRNITLIDFYGVGLGSILFNGLGENNDPLQVYMDFLKGYMEEGSVPYPILTTISVPDVRWFTATPHEFGSSSLGAYVPIWAFDRDFKDGISIGSKPYSDQVGLSGLIAMSASAMAASFGDLYFNLFSSLKEGTVKSILQAILEKSPLERLRFLYYERSNFLYGILGLPIYDTFSGKTWGDIKSIKYTDAGVLWVNPIPPLFDRMKPGVPTILIIQDASGKVGLPRLKDAKVHADGENPLNKKFPFPELNKNQQYDKKGMSALQNDDILVLYFPRVIDKELIAKHKDDPELKPFVDRQNFDMNKRMKSVYKTFNLKYKEKDARDLAAVGMFNVLANKKNIKNTIKKYVQDYINRVKSV